MKPALVLATAAIVLASGCDDTRPSGLRVSVQRWNAQKSCYATLARGDALATDLPLEAPCAEPASDVPFVAGADRVRLVIDYGDVEFDEKTTPPLPKVKAVVDGIESTETIGAVRILASGRAAFVATLVAPAKHVDTLTFNVDVATGFAHAPVGPYVVVVPPIGITSQDCPSGSCSLRGGVGNATFALSTSATVVQDATVTWSINGVRQSDSLPFKLNPVGDGRAVGVAFVPVPFAVPGSTWNVVATLGGSTASAPPIELTAPSITSSLTGCGDGGTCTLKGGQDVVLSVTAPNRIRVKQGVVSTFVNGASGTGGVAVDLALEDLTKQTLTGSLPLKAPPTGGTWLINASVGGYPAQSIVVTVLASTDAGAD